MPANKAKNETIVTASLSQFIVYLLKNSFVLFIMFYSSLLRFLGRVIFKRSLVVL